MTPNEALKTVLDTYDIKPQKLSEDSSVHKSIISKFLSGKDMHTQNLQKIVQSLPPDARTHFTMLFSFRDTKVAEKNNAYKLNSQ